MKPPPRTKDLTGMVFGEMIVLGYAGKSAPKNGKPRPRWLIKCSCGVEKAILGTTLRNTKVKSCGHLRGTGNEYPDGIAAKNLIFAHYRKNAEKMNREFSLSKDEFCSFLSSNCAYCGSGPTSVVKSRSFLKPDFYYNGIDRVDNNKGYSIDNCVPCCSICNLMKRSMPVDHFLLHVRKIYNFQKVNDCPKGVNP